MVCPHCGAPIPQATAPTLYPAQAVQLPAAPSLPGSSGVATASLVLGILSIVVSVSTYVAFTLLLVPYVDVSTGTMPSAEDVQSLARTPAALGIVALLVLGQLLAMLGLIMGIVGLTQERRRPTRSGKALGVIGIACSCIPLLCCVTYVLLAWSGAGAT
jgi:hypothetical protein